MYKLTKTQTGILLNKSGFKVSFLLVLAYVALSFVHYTVVTYGMDESMLYHPAVAVGMNSDSAYAWYFMVFYPFIVALPAAFAFSNDRRTGVVNIMIAMTGRMKYYISKSIAIFAVTFITFAGPFLINMLLNMIAYPLNAGAVFTGWEPMSETYIKYAENYLWPEVFFVSPYLYYIIWLVFFSTFSGVIAVFISSLSLIVKKYNIILLLPFYLLVQFVARIPSLIIDRKLFTFYEFYLLAYDSTIKQNAFIYIFGLAIVLVTVGIFIMKDEDVLV